MKFDCGETFPEKWARQHKWHRWFAWRPIRIEPHDCRWLEYIERRMHSGYMDDYWVYRPIGKVSP